MFTTQILYLPENKASFFHDSSEKWGVLLIITHEVKHKLCINYQLDAQIFHSPVFRVMIPYAACIQ